MRKQNRLDNITKHDSMSNNRKERKKPKIRIIRQLHSQYIDNSCLMKIQVKLTLFIPKDLRYYIYPFRKFLPNLEVTTQDGTHLVVLPHDEYLKDVTNIRQLASTLIEGVTEEALQDAENFALIILPSLEYDYYEELTLSWSESIEKCRKRSDLFSFSIPVEKEYPPMGESSLYIEMKVSPKYEILQKPSIFKPKTETWGIKEVRQRQYFGLIDESEYDKVLAGRKDYIVRFPRQFNTKLQISYLVGISNVVKIWLWLGFFLGLFISTILFLNPFTEKTVTFAVGLGMIAYFAGLRLVAIHDSELLKWWNHIIIIFILIIIILLIRAGI